ncbi:mannitol-1-phosphate 5-dehydrogenase [candidate division KSB1 bacterium]|nr:mannitol-1-phosphate 5-dehydrogenase [candidate division KSB1 bacterium]
MQKLVQFGAGSIGRSFIGQLFSRAGYEVIFIDVDPLIIETLNQRRAYIVEIRDTQRDQLEINNVRALYANDSTRIAQEIAAAAMLGTAVGKNVLGAIIPNLARGLALRYQQHGLWPIDIIICENILDGANFIRQGLRKLLPADFPLEKMLGLVETSIGKMVPIMTAADRQQDPLLVYAEAYNTLILDQKGFLNPIPEVPGLAPKANMKAYVQRKSFIHNLGHAMTAYLAFVAGKPYTCTWEMMADVPMREQIKAVMWESGRALIQAYPAEFNAANQEAHIENLLTRFANKHLGDTIFRVGRDIQRKLAYDDRIIGAMRFDLENGVNPARTAFAAAAACFFQKTDENGQMYDRDQQFHDEIFPRGIEYILDQICQLSPEQPHELQIRRLIQTEFSGIQRRFK